MLHFGDQKTFDDEDRGVFAHPLSHVRAIGVEPGMTVADFGAGSGAHVFPFAQALGESGRVYAIDVQRDLLTRIKNEANRRGMYHVDVLWGDLEVPHGSKLADDLADVVLMSNLLFQLQDKHASLAEAKRILKPTGKLAIIDWDARLPDERSVIQIGPHRRDLVPKQRALEYALAAGFEPISEFDAGSHHFGIIFRSVIDTLPGNL